MFLGVVDYFFKSMTYHYKLLQFIAGGVKTALELTSRQWIYLMNDLINPSSNIYPTKQKWNQKNNHIRMQPRNQA